MLRLHAKYKMQIDWHAEEEAVYHSIGVCSLWQAWLCVLRKYFIGCCCEATSAESLCVVSHVEVCRRVLVTVTQMQRSDKPTTLSLSASPQHESWYLHNVIKRCRIGFVRRWHKIFGTIRRTREREGCAREARVRKIHWQICQCLPREMTSRSSRGSVDDLGLLLPVWTRDDRPRMSQH